MTDETMNEGAQPEPESADAPSGHAGAHDAEPEPATEHAHQDVDLNTQSESAASVGGTLDAHPGESESGSPAPTPQPPAASEPEPAVAVTHAAALADAPPQAAESHVPPTTEAPPTPSRRGDEMAAQVGDDYSRSFPSLREGDVVQGTVVHIDREGVLVDVGTKSEGIIRRSELSRDTNVPADEIVKVGERIDVYVMETENQDGNLILSKKRADFEKAWERVQEAKEQNATLHAMVTDRVKGGLVVDLGIRGFVPASHVGNGSMKNNLERYVGQSIPLKVIEVDKERRKVVLSNKLAMDEDRQARKAETVASLQPGQIRHGVVRRLTNYGAFVDLGGIDGLLHISEMSWTRINHPSEVLKEGQDLDVKILKMDLDQGRVSLGLRDILPDPWTEIAQRYHPGDTINGTVTRVVPFGAFVQVEGGVEGIIPNSELAGRKGAKTPALSAGTEVEVKVIDVRPDERKMTLSLRQARQEQETRREREEVDEYQSQMGHDEPRYTIGDAFRAQQAEEAEEEKEEEEEE